MNALDRQRLNMDSRTKVSQFNATRLFRAGKALAAAHSALMEMNPRPNTANLEYLQAQIRVWFRRDADDCGWREATIKDYLEVMK